MAPDADELVENVTSVLMKYSRPEESVSWTAPVPKAATCPCGSPGLRASAEPAIKITVRKPTLSLAISRPPHWARNRMLARPHHWTCDYWKQPDKSRQNARFGRLLVLLFVLGLFGCSRGRRPNILLITIDTLRFDRLGCYGFE